MHISYHISQVCLLSMELWMVVAYVRSFIYGYRGERHFKTTSNACKKSGCWGIWVFSTVRREPKARLMCESRRGWMLWYEAESRESVDIMWYQSRKRRDAQRIPVGRLLSPIASHPILLKKSEFLLLIMVHFLFLFFYNSKIIVKHYTPFFYDFYHFLKNVLQK